MGAAAGVAKMGTGMFSFIKRQEENRRVYRENEASYNFDAQYTELVGQRKLNLLSKEQDAFFDKQKGQLAKSGISFDGSALDILANTRAEQMREREAVKLDTHLKKQQLYQKAADERSKMEQQDQWAWLDYTGSMLGDGAELAKSRGD